MKVLLTNIWLDEYAGTEVYVRDLALELQKRGLHVEVYSPRLGRVAQEIKQAGIHICAHTQDLQAVPDIIHGHQFLPTMDAIVRFQDTPVVYFVHDRSYPGDTPPQTKRVVQYVAVDQICRQKLLRHQIDPEQIQVILNWVDTKRFYVKKTFRSKPTNALVYSNNAKKDNYFKIIKKACDQTKIHIDGIGRGFQNSIPNPEDILVKYDMVFAKGKAAIESLAAGAAVIVCDFRGLGGLVTTENYDFYRENNFGMNSMVHDIEQERIVSEIKQYNAQTIQILNRRIRQDADFARYVDQLLSIYQTAIRTYRWKRHLMNRSYEERLLRTYLQCREALKA